MTTREFLLSAWNWHPAVLAGCAAVSAAYVALCRATRKLEIRNPKAAVFTDGRLGFFASAVLLFLLTLVSPLDTLANGYLFSAHMLQHLLLLLVVPPLLLLALPCSLCRNRGEGMLPKPCASRKAGRGVSTAPSQAGKISGISDGCGAVGTPRPAFERAGQQARQETLVGDETLPARRSTFLILSSWVAGVGAMWLWHVPGLCNAATSLQAVRNVQIVSLLALGTLFWWPILGPQTSRRLPPLAGTLYLFTACVGCTLLGILITFAPVSVCSIYLHPVDRLGVLPLIREGWGITPTVDQQVGGLMMWVPACFIYLCGIMGLLVRCFTAAPSEPVAPPATATRPAHS